MTPLGAPVVPEVKASLQAGGLKAEPRCGGGHEPVDDILPGAHIDRHDGDPCQPCAEVEHGVLGHVRRPDGDPVARLQPLVREPCRRPPGQIADLSEREGFTSHAAAHLKRDIIAIDARGVEYQLTEVAHHHHLRAG
jgi:hypothetical protein